MKAIALAHDPGGANAVAATVAALRSSGAIVEAYAKGPAIQQFQRLNVACTPVGESHQSLLEKLEGDILIAGTSQCDRFEIEGIIRAKQQNIPSLAIMDYWSNYRQRFQVGNETIWPDQIAAIDETCATEMLADGVPHERICITGQPYFAWLLSHRPTLSLSKTQRSQPPQRILFASQSHANEIVILGIVTKVLRQYPYLEKLLVRFHPRQEKCLDSLDILERSGLPYAVDKSFDVLSILQQQDMVLGITSIILLESALLGVPTGSLTIGVKDTLKTNHYGITTSLKSRQELQNLFYKSHNFKTNRAFFKQQKDADKKLIRLCIKLCHI